MQRSCLYQLPRTPQCEHPAQEKRCGLGCRERHEWWRRERAKLHGYPA
jgi:hypothetical protein